MSLYWSFTVKEWLALHCKTEKVNNLFRNALKDNDEPMAVLALAELIKRGDIDLVTYAIREAVDAGCFVLGSHFSTVFANALTNLGSRDPILRRVAKNVRRKGSWPKTASELLGDTDFDECERPTRKGCDNRLDRFLSSFMQGGWYSIEFGFFSPGTEWDPHSGERISTNNDEYSNLVVKDGRVLNEGEIHNVLGVLNTAGIIDPLPAFYGNELEVYTLDESGNWINSTETKEENFFYVSYFSVR